MNHVTFMNVYLYDTKMLSYFAGSKIRKLSCLSSMKVSTTAFVLLTISCFVQLLLPVEGSLDKPLMLSPLIKKSQIKQAQNLSLVKDEKSVIPTSYAGFITVDEKLGNHLFFWFFPSTSGAKSPLVVWLNGGPGSPSTLSLFDENGPIRLKNNGYERSNISWTQTMSMLYIDNPVGVGFSYSDSGNAGYRIDQDGYSKDLYEFIQQFYILFPEYQKRELYIGGKSYAGKYVPAFAHYLHLKIKAGISNLPLTGIYIGCPFFDPFEQSLAISDYLLAVGSITRKEANLHKNDIKEMFDEFQHNRLDISDSAKLVMRLYTKKAMDLPLKNYYSGEDPSSKNLSQFLNSTYLRNMVHVDNATLSISNSELRNKMAKDILTSTKTKLAELVEKYKVLIYTGDFDALTSPAMIDAALLSMKWSRQEEYNNATRSFWLGDNGTLSGFYSRTGNLCQVVIKGAGHSAGYDQPKRAYNMMNFFIQKGCISK
ncbi:probable serine carboxypeptidase CPVL [Physella acuta]|uniref:probable serine carboxypeptidase CPVL n=1 Tax=Physella acuta TaxID=109671 RepID=UPI0027DB0807|nr:probable serine carboxypeptidase CPVL [Physella acuta]